MKKEKQVVIDSMDVYLSKVTVKREGPKDLPKIATAYLTFSTPLPKEKLIEFGLSDIATDPRFKLGEEIILSEMRQGLHGTIDLTVCMVQPVSGEAKSLIESPGRLTKMTLTGSVFGFEVGYTLFDDSDWKCFGVIFTDCIGLPMVVTTKPDNRGKQEHFKQEQVDRVAVDGHVEEAGKKLGDSLSEGESIEFKSPKTGKPVTIKGKKKRKVKKNADKKR